MQIRRKNFATDPVKELDFIRALIKESIEAGFYNIDIDASTLVDIDQKSLLDQQLNNGKITAGITQFIRSIQPAGVTISIGGEIGEIGSATAPSKTCGLLWPVIRNICRPDSKVSPRSACKPAPPMANRSAGRAQWLR